MVALRKKFSNYKDFAGKTMEQVFEEAILQEAEIIEVGELRSGYLENRDGRFEFVPFPELLQVAPIKAWLSFDFDGDGTEELLAAGNYFGLKPHQGRLDSFPGALIRSKNEIILGNRIGLDLMNRSARHLEVIRLGGVPYLLAVFNDAPAQVYELTNAKMN